MWRAALLGVVIAGCGRIGFDDAGYASEVLGDGPVAYCRLDDAASGTAKDSSPSGLDGTYMMAVTSVAGAVGGDDAAQVDGSITAYIAFPQDARLEPGTRSFSYELWLRIPVGTWTDYIDIVGKRTQCGNDTSFWNIIGYPNRVLESELRDGTPAALVDRDYDVSLGSPDEGWHHYVRVVDRSAGLLVTYVDGVAIDSRSGSALVAVSTPAPLRTGCTSESSPFGLAFALDERAIYDHALSAARVAAHYEAR